MMQDWADRLDLLERDQVAVASMQVTIRLNVPTVLGTQTLSLTELNICSPRSVVTGPSSKAPTVPSVHRLPVVSMPEPAHAETSSIQLEHKRLIEVFESPHNLSVAHFAEMAGKSRRWISYEIRAGKLLALKIGNRGQRVPDWHLNAPKHDLIQIVLKQSGEMDGWKVYDALSQPHVQLKGRTPIDAVTAATVSAVAAVVLSVLRAVKLD